MGLLQIWNVSFRQSLQSYINLFISEKNLQWLVNKNLLPPTHTLQENLAKPKNITNRIITLKKKKEETWIVSFTCASAKTFNLKIGSLKITCEINKVRNSFPPRLLLKSLTVQHQVRIYPFSGGLNFEDMIIMMWQFFFSLHSGVCPPLIHNLQAINVSGV